MPGEWQWQCENECVVWDAVKRPQYRFLTPVTTHATCSLNFDKFPVYIFDAFLIRYLPHSIFSFRPPKSFFTNLTTLMNAWDFFVCSCVCFFRVCDASVMCFWVCAYYENGSMIAMKDIFNKVSPAFFSVHIDEWT